MLVPRQFSDYLYDLNTKVHKNVYCLGGPDVEKWKCKADALTGNDNNIACTVLPLYTLIHTYTHIYTLYTPIHQNAA